MGGESRVQFAATILATMTLLFILLASQPAASLADSPTPMPTPASDSGGSSVLIVLLCMAALAAGGVCILLLIKKQ